MHWIDWLILLVPIFVVLWSAVYTKRYVRGIADYLAAGRVAGRYVISVGGMEATLSVIVLIALCESEYQCGMAVGFWGRLVIPVWLFISLTGYVLYRYRQTRALSLGQFLETRYNRPFRIVAAFIRTTAEMLTNAIGPAVAARFFIYFMGFPLTLDIFGFQVSTFAAVMIVVLGLAMAVIWPGGRIALLVTDTIQGLLSYPIFIIFCCFVLCKISWQADVAPVMLDRVPGESFLNPMDIHKLRDFNIFAMIVTIVGAVLNRGAWIGNDTSGAGRTPHEQKMAGVLGTWRQGFSVLMLSLLSLYLVTVMHAGRFAERARSVRQDLAANVAEETMSGSALKSKVMAEVRAIPAMRHTIGRDRKYSRAYNPDTVYLDTVKKTLNSEAEIDIGKRKLAPDSAESNNVRGKYNLVFQKFRTLYFQMMTPVLLRKELPVGLMGLMCLLVGMLMLSSDDSRIFNSAATLVQDVVMPLRRKPFEKREHLRWLRGMSAAVCVFFFVVSIFLSQIDYIQMFVSCMCALWLGAAGPIMLGGLYTRWGNTTGAFCALIFGSGTALVGQICQRTWQETIYPFLLNTGTLKYLETFFGLVTKAFSPLVVWTMSPDKFPINSFEIYFLSMLFGCLAYVAGSLLTGGKPYDLDRMLHRDGRDAETHGESPWNMRNLLSRMIGITGEYTKGDRIIAWSIFIYSFIYQFVLAVAAVIIWNMISPWPASWWSWYFFITIIVVGILVGTVSTVWFMWGGSRDMKQLFRDLALRKDNPLDDGWIDGHISRADKAELADRDAEK